MQVNASKFKLVQVRLVFLISAMYRNVWDDSEVIQDSAEYLPSLIFCHLQICQWQLLWMAKFTDGMAPNLHFVNASKIVDMKLSSNTSASN